MKDAKPCLYAGRWSSGEDGFILLLATTPASYLADAEPWVVGEDISRNDATTQGVKELGGYLSRNDATTRSIEELALHL